MSVITFTRRFGAARIGWRAVLAPDVRRYNPSLLLGTDGASTDLVAHREWSSGLSASIARLDVYRGGEPVEQRDLAAECAAFGIAPVADPKLFRLRGEPWMTFNTGSPSGRNELYIRRLVDSGDRPIRCDLDGRRAIEKNWQFAEHDGRFVAVYSAEPLIVLEGPLPDPDCTAIEFRRVVGAAPEPERTGWRRRMIHRSLSLGTPLLAAGDDRFRLIVHEKWHVLGKRLYVARAAELELGETPRMRFGRHRLIHSAASLLGTWPRLNPNLLFCTYVSGISGDPDAPVVAMGMSDARGAFAQVEWEEIFGR